MGGNNNNAHMRVLAWFTNINSESLSTSLKGAPALRAALSQEQSKYQLHLVPPVPEGRRSDEVLVKPRNAQYPGLGVLSS